MIGVFRYTSIIAAGLSGMVMIFFDLIDCLGEPQAVLLLYSPAILLMPAVFWLISLIASTVSIGAFCFNVGYECFALFSVCNTVGLWVMVKLAVRFKSITSMMTDRRQLTTLNKEKTSQHTGMNWFHPGCQFKCLSISLVKT